MTSTHFLQCIGSLLTFFVTADFPNYFRKSLTLDVCVCICMCMYMYMYKPGCIVATAGSEAREMKKAATTRSNLSFYMLLASVRLSLNVVLQSAN